MSCEQSLVAKPKDAGESFGAYPTSVAAFAVRTCPELYLILEDRWKNAQPPVGPLPSGPEALVKTRLLCMVPPAEFFKSCAGRTGGGGENVAASALSSDLAPLLTTFWKPEHLLCRALWQAQGMATQVLEAFDKLSDADKEAAH